MKKFLSVLLVAGVVGLVSAQSSASNVTHDDVSKLSVAVKAGLNYDFVMPKGNFGSSLGTLLPGISLDYNFNPIFGMGVDFSMLSYNRSIDHGKTNDLTVYSSVNLSNLFSPVRTSNKLNFYGSLGGGLGWYSYKMDDGNTNNATSPLMTYGLLAEYSLSRNLALGLEGQYRFYMDFDDNVGVAPINGLGVDGAVAAVSLRYKFGGKNSKHTRNMSMEDYYPSPAKQLAEVMKAENDALKQQINALKGDNAAVNQRVDKLEGDVSALKAEVGEAKKTVDQLVTEVNAPDFDLPAVLFQFQTNKLTQESTTILNNVVDILQNNVFNKVVLSGHADNIGSEGYNQNLGLRRANAVKDMLSSKGIPAEKIETNSFGETMPVAPNTTPAGRQLNRRVEFKVK